MKTKIASISKDCVACGCCVRACSLNAISVHKGKYAVVSDKCVGCGKCAYICPADAIEVDKITACKVKQKHLYDFLWVGELLYIALGFFNILFAWLGLIFMMTPLFMAIIGGNKSYCRKYCGKGQLFGLVGSKLSLKLKPPRFLRSKWFRSCFLTFFMTMFALMLYSVVRVFGGAELSETITLLWAFKLPWNWAALSFVPTWVAQFAFGFYGTMLTSTILGITTMVLFRPRTFCVYCPMGTMTQGICRLKKS